VRHSRRDLAAGHDPDAAFGQAGRSPVTLYTSSLPRERGNAPPSVMHFAFPDTRIRWHWLPNQHLTVLPAVLRFARMWRLMCSAMLYSSLHTSPCAALLAERTRNLLYMQHDVLS
jgi:hypothetical protein